ncbi:MAG: hypothetical protein R3C61_20740 [Bacteroidia bacterium]
MGTIFKEALNLPESLRYQLAILLLHSLEPRLVDKEDLTEEQFQMLYEAKAEIEAGKTALFSREDLRTSIQQLRESRKKAS